MTVEYIDEQRELFKEFDDQWYAKLAAFEVRAAGLYYWPSGQPTEITIHFDGANFDSTIAQINEWHRDRGFTPRGTSQYRYCGYHEVIRRAGDSYIGRTLDVVGTHCLGHNHSSLGVCLTGGLMNGYPTGAQIDELSKTCNEWMGMFGIPIERIHFHREFNATNCPGNLDKNYVIEKIRGYPIMPSIEVTQIHREVRPGYYRGLAIVDCGGMVSAATFQVDFPKECQFNQPPDCLLGQPNGANYGAIIGSQDVSKDRVIGTLIEKADVAEVGGKIKVSQPRLQTVGILIVAWSAG